MNEKYLYFRNVTSIGDDDDTAGSVMFPVSSVRGIYTMTATLLFVSIEPPIHLNKKMGSAVHDYASILVSSGKGPEVINALNEEIATGDNYFIVVGDDVTSEYLTSDITSIGVSSIHNSNI
tara:strand:- start:4604 stop:4966 length:363 start_codon:yes stop_codon:yes gene_type:complete